jgi:hypothetical protein
MAKDIENDDDVEITKKKGKPKVTDAQVNEVFEEFKAIAEDDNLNLNEDEGKYSLITFTNKRLKILSKPMSAAQFVKSVKFAMDMIAYLDN